MSDPAQPTYLVSAYSDPVVVKVNGKANYLNCNAFREFIETVITGGCRKLFIDFVDCKGMDSTFLGILAGTAIHLRTDLQSWPAKPTRHLQESSSRGRVLKRT